MKTKACSKCKRVLPEDTTHFNRNVEGVNGLRPECRDCQTRINRQWQQTHRVEIRRKGLEYHRKNPDVGKRAKKKWVASHPIQHAAKEILRYAIRQGRVTKPDRCEKCGIQKPKPAIHGHHHDYAYPLDVTWLCALCHAAVHMKGGGI